MKSTFLICFSVMTLLATLAFPVGVAAQQQKVPQQHYKLIDLGTFGGPTSWFCNDLNGGGGACPILNSRGTLVSGADTADSNPNYQNCNGLLPPFNAPMCDPFIQHAFQWQGGALQDLGVLSGGYNSFAQAISANGLVAGMSENGLTDPLFNIPAVNAVLWNNGQIVNLGTLEGGYESLANGVNSGGQVVGESLNTVPDPFLFGFQVRAFLWQNGAMQDLGTLGTGTDAFAYYINERGQVAGTSFTNTTINPVTGTPTQDPFLWENGTLTDLGTLGGTSGQPNALNNKGQVVGDSNLAGDLITDAFLWEGGKLKDLGTLPGGIGSSAIWINDTGQIVGGSFTPNPSSPFHAVLWNNNAITDLGTVAGDMCSGALGVNSKGQITGFSSVDCMVNTHAFLWEDGQLIDLNMFNHPGSGLDQLLLAYNINDSGEIAGLGVPPGVEPADVFTLGHTFVLIPCDESHPGVEGCDYSMIEASTVASGSTASVKPAQRGTSNHMPRTALSRRRSNRFHFPAIRSKN
jgi:probable HAF family extracellular repeat protein